ncbi:hypothetical protein [Ensifer sp. 4252]|uniref:hypothetical protein n=1 Tax=Ensifer sp. 4252 TaxID=3373915 RepID=UPI003D1BACD9
MKIVIAALASIAFATSAIAAVPSTPAEKMPIVKTVGQIELAHGGSRGLAASTRNVNTDPGKKASAKGAAQTGGKTMSGK